MPKRGAKKLPSGLEDQKRAGSKNFWCNLGKALGPPSGHPRKFLIHAQSWLKPAVDFPLNRNFRCPKRPPLGSERVFFKLGYLGVRYCPPWPSFVKIWRPPSVQSGPVRAGKPVKVMILGIMFIRVFSQRTLDTWNGMLWEIFLNLKPMEIAKRPYNIICRSIKVMHFCQIIRAWLNIWARHAHLKFEI